MLPVRRLEQTQELLSEIGQITSYSSNGALIPSNMLVPLTIGLPMIPIKPISLVPIIPLRPLPVIPIAPLLVIPITPLPLPITPVISITPLTTVAMNGGKNEAADFAGLSM